MKKKLIDTLFNIFLVVIILVVCVGAAFMIGYDEPPKLALNGTELDLTDLRVSDMNDAGFYLGNNDGSLPGNTYKEFLSYYDGEDGEISQGGISVLNGQSSKREYVDCRIFEISAKSHNKEGEATGLEATYNGEEFFGETKDDLIDMFGEPGKDTDDSKLIYYSKKKQYTTTFYFDDGGCYCVEIRHKEDNLIP